MIQANTEVERDQDAKYVVGTVLTFRSYDPDEVEHLGDHHEYTFKRGDKLRVVERNGCGMGIDVVRLSDGHHDMVWPTEVVVSRRQF